MNKQGYIRLANMFANRLIQAKDNYERLSEINEIIFHFCEICEEKDTNFNKRFFKDYIDMILSTQYKDITGE